MQYKPVTIATFSQAYEAHLHKAELEAAGIPAFIKDEEIVSTLWLYSSAVGGVKLQVDEQNVDKAKKVLAGIKIESRAATIDKDTIVCPVCGKDSIYPERPVRKVFLSIILLGFPLPFIKKGSRCQTCRFFWSKSKPVTRESIETHKAKLKKRGSTIDISAVEREIVETKLEEKWPASKKTARRIPPFLILLVPLVLLIVVMLSGDCGG